MSTGVVDPLGSTVYRRTQKGQIVCAARASSMDAQFLKWLRLFNGLTPTQVLLELVAIPVADAQAIIDKLISLRLIELVSPAPDRQHLYRS
jgi:hypothetical protein